VAVAFEDMPYTDDTGEIFMRGDNHQLLQALFISTLVKAGSKGAKLDVEHTGLGFRTDTRIDASKTLLPTTCRMKRPG
jgi:branched-chain amino acid transport system substrate-binding protein